MRRNLFVLLPWVLAGAPPESAPVKSSDLFVEQKVWTVHLKFTAAEWEAMEPKGGPGMGGPRPVGFSPANFIAPAFLKGDRNGDGKLSRAEFEGLGNQWFAQWDAAKANQLSREQLSQGLNTVLEMPGPGMPGPGMPAPPTPPTGSTSKRGGGMNTMGVEFEYAHAALEFAGKQWPDVAVRYKGNSTFMMSRGSLKRSLKIDLNRYQKDGELAGVTTLNLHCGVADASWMNEVLSHRLYREAGVPAPRTAYARVFVTVDGKYERKYLGLYSLVEDVDDRFIAAHYGTKTGALFKPVTRRLFEDLGLDWSAYSQPYDAKSKLTAAQKSRVMEFSKFLSHASDEELVARAGEYLDLDQFARYMATTVWLSTLDSLLSMGQNFYVYLNPKSNRFEFLPWDLDHSFGQFPMAGTQESREGLSIVHPWQGANRFLERVFRLDAFQSRYRARLSEYSKTIFQPARFGKQVDALAVALRPAVAEESPEKLARFDKLVAGESVESAGFGRPGAGGPPGFGPPGFGGPPGGAPPGAGRTKPIKAFVGPRSESVLAQLAGKSEGITSAGRGGPGGFPGPGMMMGRMIFPKFDANQDDSVSRDEFRQAFARWFTAWNSDQSGELTGEQLSKGINQDLMPPMPFGPGGPMGPGGPGPGRRSQ